MLTFIKSKSLLIGLAMFSMFFGAGNVIFPLAVGQFAGDKNFFAILGLIMTAAVMPIAGVVAMILYDGNYKDFFGRLGKWPGLILAAIVISLLGPLGSTPRCIALSYTTLKSTFFDLPPVIFSALSCCLIFLFTIKKNHILKLLGYVLTPILLISLITIITVGLLSSSEIDPSDSTNLAMFFHGLKEGYNTMDLLAAFFFSSSILNSVRKHTNYISTALRASIVGAILLSAVYIGFSYLAAFHGKGLGLIGKDELLSALTLKIAGKNAGLLVCITVAFACLTTAIALISSFADFFQKEIFKEKISYRTTLIGSLLVTFFISTFEFSGISAYLGPLLEICYPGLILLTFLNIAYRLKNFKPIKIPVFMAFALSTLLYMIKTS